MDILKYNRLLTNKSMLTNVLYYFNRYSGALRLLVLFTIIIQGLYKIGIIPIYKSTDINEILEINNNDPTFFDHIVIDEVSNNVHFYVNNTYSYYASISSHGDYGETIRGLFGDELHINYHTTNSIFWTCFDIFKYFAIVQAIIYIFSKYMTYFSPVSIINPDSDNDNDNMFKLFKPMKDNNGVISGNTFINIIGHKEGKTDLQECVKFFKHKQKYIEAGHKVPKGVLLIGPPGTGKTLLARTFANECDANFINVCGSDFIEIFAGMGSRRVRKLFDVARQNSPCIIFIDEIDAIGGKRNHISSSNSEHGSTLNKLLSEMDGFNGNEDIMIIGATNRAKTLDGALTRSGRFDKKIYFDLPNIDEREQLFNLYLKKKKLDISLKDIVFKNNKLKILARLTAGLSGADIENVCNQSVRLFMQRVQFDSESSNWNDENIGVTVADIEKAIDIVMIGSEKPERKMSEEERNTVSHHEAGHSLVAYMLKNTTCPIKVSIIPRGEAALGFSQQEPVDKKLYSKDELLGKLIVLYGGRVAEQLIFNKISTGASDDIEKATQLAYSIVTTYGMGKYPMNAYGDNFHKYASEYIKKQIDEEVMKMLDNAYLITTNLLNEHIDQLKLVGECLLEKEVLLSSDMDEILEQYDIKNKF
jgi:AFG3 family protein